MQIRAAVDWSRLLGTLHDSARESLLPLDFGISLLDFGPTGCPINSETHRVLLSMQAAINDVARGNLLAYSLRPETVLNERESLH